MLQFQQRVVEEKAELDAKLDRLTTFLADAKVQALSNEEQVRLRQQAEVMAHYSAILGERIAAF